MSSSVPLKLFTLRIAKKREITLDNQIGVQPIPKLLALSDKVLVFHFDPQSSSTQRMFCDAYSHRLKRLWRKVISIGQELGDVSRRIKFFQFHDTVYALDTGNYHLSLFDCDMNYKKMSKLKGVSHYDFLMGDGQGKGKGDR